MLSAAIVRPKGARFHDGSIYVKDEPRAESGAVAEALVNRIPRGERIATASSDNRYARLYAKASIPCLALDPGGVIREANIAAGELLGTRADELVGQTLFRFLVDRQQVVLHDHFQRLSEPADELHVAVEDTGIGIEPERMARIFLPFVQADPSISRNFGGMGLGLSISKALAEAHQGSIIVASQGPGRGSTFTLAMRSLRSSESIPPAGPDLEALAEHQMPSIPPPPKMPSTSPPATLRVLLVEDDPDTLEVTSMLLSQGGYDVATAKSVAQALVEVHDREFDLLISDIALADGSGLDLMREIHEQKKDLKGIALSGFGTQEDVRRTKLAGFTAHLTKPVSFPRLVTTIRQITG